MTPQIPLNTLLGDRYKITAHVMETAGGDVVLDGLDQVLGRKVSIVIASPEHNRLLVANARRSTTLTRSAVQVLDLGNRGESTYLITSYARPDILLDVLLTEHGETAEEFGEEIFGDTGSMTAPNAYVVSKENGFASGTAISATRPVDAVVTEDVEEGYEEYDAEEEGYYEVDEPIEERNGGVWVVGIAAALLLVIGAGAVFATLGGLSKSDSGSSEASAATSSASAPETSEPSPSSSAASSSASPSPTPSPTKDKLAKPKFGGVFARSIPSSPALMAESDAQLSRLTDGNAATVWSSLGFPSPNFGGLADSMYLSAQLSEETTVNSITINQVSGVGGAFSVYASETASIDGGTEVGSGSFAASGETTVQLNADAQDGKTKYIIIKFTAVPQLSQPIVSGYPYGLRIAEISIN